MKRREAPRWLRNGVVLATAVLLAVVVGTLTEPTGEDTDGGPPPLLPPPSTGTAIGAQDRTVATDVDEPIRASAGVSAAGALPDGTPFQIDLEGTGSEDRLGVDGISAGIVMDLEDGSSPVVGITSFGTAARQGDVAFEAGDWIVGIDVYDDIKHLLGDGWASEIRSHVSARHVNGYPVLEFVAPFRFAADEELPLAMEVMYPDFVVRRGCGELAFRCNSSGAVQLILLDPSRSHAASLWIQSTAPRSGETYVDPGPLSPRGNAVIAWTGSEMLVYGGETAGGVGLTDGALFDPVSAAWRSIPDPPAGTGSTAGAWADDQLVVISDELTAAFDPGSTTWEVVAAGARAISDVVFDGTRIVAWGNGAFALNTDRMTWESFDSPSEDLDESWQRALRVVDGDVYAVGTAASCRGQQVWRLDDTNWVPIRAHSIATEEYAQCNVAADSGGIDGRLLVWEDDIHPSGAYDPAIDGWVEIEPPPIGGCDGGSQSVVVGDRLLVHSCGDAAMFDPADQSWRRVALPGHLGFTDAVWTGSEVLAWTTACCFDTVDAWRWRPPE